MANRLLIAGVTGRLGSYLLPLAQENGYIVRGVSRNPAKVSSLQQRNNLVAADLCRPETLAGICDDIQIVFSAAGASLDPNAIGDRATYPQVDYHGNLNLLKEAQAAGVKRFVYVSVFGAPQQRHLTYCDAHERFADVLMSSGLSYCIIRPTGFFGVFQQMFDMAKSGMGIMIGDGSPRTNPIHEIDLARVCLEALDSDETEINVGGPEIITRKDVLTLAFEALGKKPRILAVPPIVFRTAAAVARPVQPRISQLLKFGVEVSVRETLAPAFGKLNLADYYRGLAEGSKGER